MPKRILIGILSGLFIASVVFLIFNSKGRNIQSISISEAVPENAVIFIDKIDFNYFNQSFKEENDLWRQLVKFPFFSDRDSLYGLYFGFFNKLNDLDESRIKEGFGISLHLLGKNRLAPIIYFPINSDLTGEEIGSVYNDSFHSNFSITQRNYDGENIWSISEGEGSETILSYTIKNGILLCSKNGILIEDALRTINFGGGFNSNDGFKEIESTAGRYVQGNIYVNFKNIHHLFSPLIEPADLRKLTNLSDFGHLAGYDMDLDNESVLLSGMTFSNDSSPAFLNLFRGQQPVKTESTSIIPAFASEFLTIAISDIKLFSDQLNKFLNTSGQTGTYRKENEKLLETLGLSPVNELLTLLSDEISWFKLDVNSNGDFQEVVIFELKSRSEAIDIFGECFEKMAKEHNVSPKNLKMEYHLDNQSSYDIYSFPEQLYNVEIISKFLKTNFSFYENYLIFSSSKDAIKRTIYQNVLRKTIRNEQGFEQMNELVSTKSNLTYYINPERFFTSYENAFTPAAKSLFTDLMPIFQKIPGIIIQFSNEGDLLYSNISLKYTSNLRENALTVWESLLDSVVINKPALVRNHNTGEREIMVQDASNALYLINSTGRILWKMRLDNPVMNEIVQVDYYNNGKLQYLFNTRDAIHLVDRNGNYVERYPIKLRSDATNGMSLFDYDKNNDYRIFIATENKRIYVYDLEGKLVTGWSFGKTEGIVSKPAQHFRLGEKDYIVISDNIRTYILNRQGKERVEINDQKIPSIKNSYFLSMNISDDNPHIISTDLYGNVFGIDFRGNVHTLLDNSAHPQHLFMLQDLDHDGQPEYIIMDLNNLKVFNSEGKILFSFKIKGDISNMLGLYEFSSSDVKIGITDSIKNEIFLLNSDGSVYEGFPLEGNSRFSIGYFAGSDSRFNLIVGNSDSFIYNYSIE